MGFAHIGAQIGLSSLFELVSLVWQVLNGRPKGRPKFILEGSHFKDKRPNLEFRIDRRKLTLMRGAARSASLKETTNFQHVLSRIPPKWRTSLPVFFPVGIHGKDLGGGLMFLVSPWP